MSEVSGWFHSEICKTGLQMHSPQNLSSSVLLQDAFEAARPMFSILTISDVIPAEAREAYAAAGGDTL